MKQTNTESHSHQAPLSEPKEKLTVLQSVFSGSVSGALEVLVNHPLWSIKTRMQAGEAFTFNPRVLYRGLLLNTASMTPITALQVGLDRSLQNLLSNGSSELSSTKRFTSAFVAGVGSAFFCCPSEMIMTDLKKDGVSFYAAGQRLVNQGGLARLYTGLLGTALREGLFTAFFLAVTPTLKGQIKPYCQNDYAASLFAGMGSGVGATLLSQGVDTVKTIQQSSNDSASFWQTTKKLY